MKLAILGSGQIVMDFLTMAKDLPDTELVSMFGIEAERAKMEGLANTYGIGKVYTDYQEVLNDPECDTIYVGLPNHLHYTFTKQALENGKHVICEKPLARTSTEARAIVDAAAAASTFFMPAMCMRFWPGWDWLDSQDIGGLIRHGMQVFEQALLEVSA